MAISVVKDLKGSVRKYMNTLFSPTLADGLAIKICLETGQHGSDARSTGKRSAGLKASVTSALLS